jgi:predicted DNA-binding transcriptional regulator YafY
VPPSRTAERLRRLLVIVPYVIAHPGTPIDELTRLFGITEAELTADLQLLFMTGLPPYTPDALIEAEWESGRVEIRMADYFSRPVRLTRPEALALYLKGTQLLGTAGLPEAEALRSALHKLAERLGPENLEGLQAEVEKAGGLAQHLGAVREAAAARERIEIDYYSASRDEDTTRQIDPEQVFSAMGNWYVVAWCHRARGERMFRVDRVRGVRPTGERFEPRGLLGAGRELYTPTREDVRVRLRLGPSARWVAEYYAMERVQERRGGVEVTFPTKDLAWVAKLVLRLGGEARILAPQELVELTRRTARETLARYG